MPGMPYKIMSIVTRKLEGVNHFHYYLCRQLKGGGMEIFMNQEMQEKTKKVFYETGEKLAVTDPEFVELITNFFQGEVTKASKLTEKERMLCILSALLW